MRLRREEKLAEARWGDRPSWRPRRERRPTVTELTRVLEQAGEPKNVELALAMLRAISIDSVASEGCRIGAARSLLAYEERLVREKETREHQERVMREIVGEEEEEGENE